MDKLSKLFNSRKTKIEYTEGQKQALLKISKFLESKDNFFLLSGYSGCGKTTIAENIANFTKCTLLAPTNAAVNRLRDKINNDNLIYKTIHSLLFSSKDDKNGFYEDKTFKRKATYIIDECSMIDKYVLDVMIKQATKFECKLIFLGDSFQLEPVGEDPKIFLWEKSYPEQFKEINKYELTEVKRYDGSLLKIATEIRTVKKANVTLSKDSDLFIVKKFSKNLASDIVNNKNYVVLTSTNKRRIIYNQKIRTYLYKLKTGIKYAQNNDVLVSVTNSEDYANGEIFTIKNAVLLKEFDIFVLNKKNNLTPINILLYRHNGQLTLLIPDLLESSIHGKQIVKGILDSGDVLERNIFQMIIVKTFFNRQQNYILNKEVNIATYGYAISCHKAQGQEWDNVYIDAYWLMPVWDHAKWFYTAITRAKNKVEINNTPYLNVKQE